jgi:pSer/pThr/pTyr-binding forkhead associated (FHA) protein
LPDIDVSKLPNSTVVSSLHAEIRGQGNSYFIEDLASDFGTYLNQSRLTALTRYELHWGDRIDLGENKQFTLIFQGKRPFFNFLFLTSKTSLCYSYSTQGRKQQANISYQ